MLLFAEFEQQVKEIQAQRAGLGAKNGNEEEEDEENRARLGAGGIYDTEIYGGGKFAGYATSIAPTEEQEVGSLYLCNLCCLYTILQHFC